MTQGIHIEAMVYVNKDNTIQAKLEVSIYPLPNDDALLGELAIAIQEAVNVHCTSKGWSNGNVTDLTNSTGTLQ